MSYNLRLPFILILFALGLIVYIMAFAHRSKRNFAAGNRINDETIELSSRANFLYGNSRTLSDGGYLVLTDKQLWFFPHRFNLSTEIRCIPRQKIRGAVSRKSLGVVPNGLGVQLADGKNQYFVVKKRPQWLEALSAKPRKS